MRDIVAPQSWNADTRRLRVFPDRFPLRRTSGLISAAVTLVLVGCKPTPPTVPIRTAGQAAVSNQYPARPTIAPPPFKLFHTTSNSITLVTADNATDDQITAILWQLRDAAHIHTFDELHIPQKLVDARDPYIWFHLYRGAKCASEKYTTGALPCGTSYHAAGDYTLGGFSNHDHDDGALLHDETHQAELWNSDAPYAPVTTNH